MKTSLLFSLIVCSLALYGCNSAQSTVSAASGAMPAMLVKTAPVSTRVLSDNSTFVGTLKSRQSVNLKPQVSGRILRIFVRSGDEVAAGAPLMELDKFKQEALVSNASAGIESTIEEQENARQLVKSLESTKASRQANLKFAQQQFERYKKLAAEGAVSVESVDQKQNQLGVAQGDIDAIEGQIRAQKATLSKDTKLIKQAHAAMKEQQEQLRYFTVRAPFAGQVGDIPMRVGDFVTTDTQLTTIDQTRPLELYIAIPTTESRRLHKGLTAEVMNGDGTVEQTGRVFFVGAQVDPRDQSILVKAEVDNAKESLRSGEEVNARLIWGTTSALTVPVTAVTRFTGQDFVFVAERSKEGKLVAKQKPVKLAGIEGNEYRVVSGLQPGDEIVISGTHNLSDGAPIRTGS